MQKRFSRFGFIGSLLLHSALVLFVFWLIKSTANDSANGNPAEVVDTSISMEMMMATIMEEPEPEPEVKPEPEPEIKEEVADPTIKPEPPKPEKPKEPEKKPEKPKEKPKPKPKEKPKEKPTRTDLPKADKTVISNANVNSVATTTGPVTTNNPNLAGNGRNTNEIAAYQNALRREIERRKRYPQRAKMMRKQGQVQIAFTLGADGSISGARVASSSGNEDLDNAALSAVQNANSIGPRPAGMSPSVNVPIKFSIQ